MDPKTTVLIALLVGNCGAVGKETGKVYVMMEFVIEICRIYFFIRYNIQLKMLNLYRIFWKKMLKYISFLGFVFPSDQWKLLRDVTSRVVSSLFARARKESGRAGLIRFSCLF